MVSVLCCGFIRAVGEAQHDVLRLYPKDIILLFSDGQWRQEGVAGEAKNYPPQKKYCVHPLIVCIVVIRIQERALSSMKLASSEFPTARKAY